jgi:asparagine synthase (glutamine-hydrolysing)
MSARIRHRGPDDDGFHIDGPLGLGVRRLSIIDLETGAQPIFNEDRTIAVIQNGEIYNYVELRRHLEAKGHTFRTNSDTEVAVHLYEEEGLDFVKKLNGMFAIALWDARRQRLVLLRDRLGVKPLYYAQTQEGVVFGSELKALLESEEVSRRLSVEAVYHYFSLGYIPNPFSIYEQAHQMPPAGRLVIEPGSQKLDRYWHLESRIDYGRDRAECREELHGLMADAVRCRMRSDVPLGAFLSGGIDSSITVALMAQQSSQPIRTFYIDFEEPGFSERPFAEAVARRYGTEHHELVVRPSAAAILDELVEQFDEPFGDSSAVPTYYVSKLARQHVTVALSGDAGDESFGGYSRYRRILRRPDLPRLVRAGFGGVGRLVQRWIPRTAPGRLFLHSMGMANREFYGVGTGEVETSQLLDLDFLTQLNGTSTFDLLSPFLEAADSRDPLAPYTYLDLHSYLPDDILTKVDRASMMHALEVRGPFLDYRVVELAATLPYDWKIKDGDTKIILKETFADDLPPEVMRQRKRGFSIPLAQWFCTELRPLLEDAIHDPAITDSGFFQMDEVRALAHEHWDGARDLSQQLWRFLFFARWWQLNHSEITIA